MPEQVIQAIMARRNPRTGSNYTRDEAEAIIHARVPMRKRPIGKKITIDESIRAYHRESK